MSLSQYKQPQHGWWWYMSFSHCCVSLSSSLCVPVKSNVRATELSTKICSQMTWSRPTEERLRNSQKNRSWNFIKNFFSKLIWFPLQLGKIQKYTVSDFVFEDEIIVNKTLNGREITHFTQAAVQRSTRMDEGYIFISHFNSCSCCDHDICSQIYDARWKQWRWQTTVLRLCNLVFFAVSDALALFSSLKSLLIFLSALHSRFAEEDFLYALPKSISNLKKIQ